MKINSNYELKDTSSLIICGCLDFCIMATIQFLRPDAIRSMMNDHWAAALQSLKAEAEYGADQLFLIDLLSIVYWALWPPLAAITN